MLAIGLGACGGGNTPSTSTKVEKPTVAPTTTVTTKPTVPQPQTTTTAIQTGPYSNITKSVKLTVPYEGKHFINEGIGEATLVKSTDGDTATFRLKTEETVIIRFYGVDTPESTGGIEKWGKAASLFTAEKLTTAHSIVLEASTTPASVDSYGTRYLGYVWYKETADSDYKNLNLELVENGYSPSKCINTAAYKYYSAFKEAETFAKSVPLRYWSDDDDPYFSTEAQEITVKELVTNLEGYYNFDDDMGSKVRINAYIKSVEYSASSGSRTVLFQAAEIVDGDEYVFNVYVGYESSQMASYIKIGNQYSITGTVQKYSGSFQISGLTYVPMKKGGDYLYVVEKNVHLIFDSKVAYSSVYSDNLYTDLTVTNASLDGDSIELTGTAKCQNSSDSTTKEFTIIVPNSQGMSEAEVLALVGKNISTAGQQTEEGIVSVLRYGRITVRNW